MTATLEELTLRVRARRDLPPPEVRRALRRAAGIPMRDVAEIVGVTRQAVALWELGKREPRNKNLETYAEVLRTLRQEVTDLSLSKRESAPIKALPGKADDV